MDNFVYVKEFFLVIWNFFRKIIMILIIKCKGFILINYLFKYVEIEKDKYEVIS